MFRHSFEFSLYVITIAKWKATQILVQTDRYPAFYLLLYQRQQTLSSLQNTKKWTTVIIIIILFSQTFMKKKILFLLLAINSVGHKGIFSYLCQKMNQLSCSITKILEKLLVPDSTSVKSFLLRTWNIHRQHVSIKLVM